MKTSQRSSAFEIHPVVFWVSALLIGAFVVISLTNTEAMQATVGQVQSWIAQQSGWFFILAVNVVLGFAVYLCASRFGTIRLGGTDAQPEFTLWGWFAMLFSAGMGIGLLFYGVAEPMYHFAAPPNISLPEVAPHSVAAAKLSMAISFFHWGFHAWAIYAVVGLALAFFAFNCQLPLTIRSVFYPLLGERIHGPIGNMIDILAVVATLFGLATSLGLGAQQVNAGLSYLYGIEQGPAVQVIVITIITVMATVSVVLGLDKGIRRLSEMNMVLGLGLLLFLLILGPTLFLLGGFVQNIGLYLQHFLELSTWTETYQQGTWQDGWTIFYWAWWIAWSPFVGMFIARISRGRTIREFLLGVLMVPALLTFLWLTVFGGSALHQELFGVGGIATAVNDNVATALFVLLERYPLVFVSSLIGTVVVVSFFVTSSDSGSLVIDIITSGGNTNPPVAQRVFWAITEGVVASVLLLGGGLKALQTASITTGLPFAVVLLLLCLSLIKGLRAYHNARS